MNEAKRGQRAGRRGKPGDLTKTAPQQHAGRRAPQAAITIYSFLNCCILMHFIPSRRSGCPRHVRKGGTLPNTEGERQCSRRVMKLAPEGAAPSRTPPSLASDKRTRCTAERCRRRDSHAKNDLAAGCCRRRNTPSGGGRFSLDLGDLGCAGRHCATAWPAGRVFAGLRRTR